MTHARKMGYEGQLFYGAAGSTASTQITNALDLNYAYGPAFEDITVRGDGSSVPVEEEAPVSIVLEDLSWSMIEDSSDTTLAALKAAAAAGTLIAIRTKSYSSGTGFDGDVYVKCKQGAPLKGKQTFDFSCSKPNQKNRAASFNA